MREIDNKGQVLLLVTISLAVLLGIGLSISSQSISSITRTSRSDSMQKVTAAAEGGIEKYLLFTDNSLAGVVDNTNLLEKFTESNTEALVNIDYYSAGSSKVLVYPEVNAGQVATFYFSNNLATQAFNGEKSCLKITSDTSNASYMLNAVVKNSSVLDFSSASSDINYDPTTSNKYLMEKYIVKEGSMTTPSPTSCSGGYEFTNIAMLRVHPVNGTIKNLKIEILNSSINNLSDVIQGYRIISTGKFSSGSDSSKRTIEAIKFLDSPSYLFDYAAFID